jgi:hypothetical protein
MRRLRNILDGDVPDDVPQWIVQFQSEFDQRDLTPLGAAELAYKDILHGHSCIVMHVRSGLRWSVNLERSEVIEVKVVRV